MDKLTALTVFRRVVELKGFSRAARALGLSNAAVSKNVRELEEELGAQLLHRTTRHLSLTSAGEIYFNRIVELLDELRQADAAVNELNASPRGSLRLAAPMSLGIVLLAEAIGEFLSQYPDLRIDLEMSDRYVDVVHEGFDVALRAGDALRDSSLVARKLSDVRRVVCAAPRYLTEHGVPKSPSDLRGHRCLLYTLSSSPSGWAFRKGGMKQKVDVDGPLRVNNSLGLVRAATAGTGIALVPLAIARDHLAHGELRQVLGSWQAEPQALYAVYPQHRQASHKLRLLLGFLADRLGRVGC